MTSVDTSSISSDLSSSGLETSKSPLHVALENFKPELNLSGRVIYDNRKPVTHGGYCDVFLGILTDIVGKIASGNDSETRVAVKYFRVHLQYEADFVKTLAKEIKIWSKLKHPNILPFLGFIIENDCVSLISKWIDNGSAKRFVQQNPECDLMRLTLGIAEGLEYLHNHGVVHSDLKAENILVSSSGKPLICDFGISRMISASETLTNTTSHTGGAKGTLRWMATELIYNSEENSAITHTKKTDVWAFGMTVNELLTKKSPFSHLKNDGQVFFAILNGNMPTKPTSLVSYSLNLWSICEACWIKEPAKRPSIGKIVFYLRYLRNFREEEEEGVADSADCVLRSSACSACTNSYHRCYSWAGRSPHESCVRCAHLYTLCTSIGSSPQQPSPLMLIEWMDTTYASLMELSNNTVRVRSG